MKPITSIAFYHYLKSILIKLYDLLVERRLMNNNNNNNDTSLSQHSNNDDNDGVDDHYNHNYYHQLRLFAQGIQNWKRKNGGMINLFTFRVPLSPPIQCRQQYTSNHHKYKHQHTTSNNGTDNDHLSSHFPHPHHRQQRNNDNNNNDNGADLNLPSFDEFILFSLQSVWIQAQHSSNLEGTHTLCVLIIESLQLISEFIQKVS